jgi:hypothetical protein
VTRVSPREGEVRFNGSVLRRHRLLALAVPALLLTGCGVEATQFSPGVAARVDGTTFTTRHVDRVVNELCAVAVDQAGDQGGSVPLSFLSRQVAATSVLSEAAHRLAAEYDVQPGTAYQQAVSDAEASVPDGASDELRQGIVDVQAASAYYGDVLSEIGAQDLADQGNDAPTDQEKFEAGTQALGDWLADHDVELNPTYGVDVGDLVSGDQTSTGTSFAVSQEAKQGQAAQADPGYTAALPDYLVCGS